MEIINKFIYLFQLKRIRYQNKGYDLLSVNIEMGVILGLPIMHCSHPNINLHVCLSFLNKSTSYCLEVCKYALYDKQSGLFLSEYVRICQGIIILPKMLCNPLFI